MSILILICFLFVQTSLHKQTRRLRPLRNVIPPPCLSRVTIQRPWQEMGCQRQAPEGHPAPNAAAGYWREIATACWRPCASWATTRFSLPSGSVCTSSNAWWTAAVTDSTREQALPRVTSGEYRLASSSWVVFFFRKLFFFSSLFLLRDTDLNPDFCKYHVTVSYANWIDVNSFKHLCTCSADCSTEFLFISFLHVQVLYNVTGRPVVSW